MTIDTTHLDNATMKALDNFSDKVNGAIYQAADAIGERFNQLLGALGKTPGLVGSGGMEKAMNNVASSAPSPSPTPPSPTRTPSLQKEPSITMTPQLQQGVNSVNLDFAKGSECTYVPDGTNVSPMAASCGSARTQGGLSV